MFLKLQSKQLLAIAIFSGLNSIALANTAPDINQAPPTVSKSEAKLSFWDLPHLENAFIDTHPNRRNDAIAVDKLDDHISHQTMIVNFAQQLAKGKYGKIDSLLISHKDKLVFESYYLRGRLDLPHMQASTTKSYLSLAIGRAIQMGYLTMADLDKPLVSFLKNLDLTKVVDGAETITLHKAMTMQSGIRIAREQQKQFNTAPEKLKGQGQIQTYLENTSPVTAQSQVFHYQGADPQMVMQVLEAVVPGTAKDFIQKELLDKLGISNYTWHEDTSGLPMGPSGSSMTSRNMLKWGTLVMSNGKWHGEQLISKAFINKATNKIVSLGEDDIFFTSEEVTKPGYGYYFWLADMKVGNKTYQTKSAQGGGGQYIILVEELDLIVVFTAHERDDKTMQITAKGVLPAFNF